MTELTAEDLTPLTLQRLSRRDQTLILLRMATAQRDGPAVPADLARIADAYALPASNNYSRDMSNLRSAGLAVLNQVGWRLTPEGEESLRNRWRLLLPATGGVQSGPLMFGVGHALVPPEMAPPSVRVSVMRLLEHHPWDRNVMLITRFQRDNDTDLIDSVTSLIRAEVERHGLNLLVASDRRADDRLGLNVVAHMWASKYAIALIEDRVGEGLNANVMFEAGAMVMTGRRLAVFRDVTAPRIPSDLTDHIYDTVQLEDEQNVTAATRSWLQKDLGFTPN